MLAQSGSPPHQQTLTGKGSHTTVAVSMYRDAIICYHKKGLPKKFGQPCSVEIIYQPFTKPVMPGCILF